MPPILLEPGRSIVANAGLTLYEVGGVKTIEGYRSYVTVNGGMTDNPRYALYQSPYTVLPASRMGEEGDFLCSWPAGAVRAATWSRRTSPSPQPQRGICWWCSPQGPTLLHGLQLQPPLSPRPGTGPGGRPTWRCAGRPSRIWWPAICNLPPSCAGEKKIGMLISYQSFFYKEDCGGDSSGYLTGHAGGVRLLCVAAFKDYIPSSARPWGP